MRPAPLPVPRLHEPGRLRSKGDLRALQRLMAAAIFRPLTGGDHMQRRWIDGRPMARVAGEFMKPNDRMSAFERLEIYNRVYWFRVLDSMYEDCPGLHALLGPRRFWRLAKAYLVQYPSRSFTLRDLCSRLARFIAAEPELTAPHTAAALDVARFEWAQVVAFDAAALPQLPVSAMQSSQPEQMRLGLQPYLSLLALNHAVDDYVLAVKQRDRALRTATSNAVASKAETEPAPPSPRLRRERVFLAVHRIDNQIYYKRLLPEEYRMLKALSAGRALADACAAAFRRSRQPPSEQADLVRSWFTLWGRFGWICSRE